MGMLVIAKNWGVFHHKNKQNGGKHRQNPRGKLLPDTRRLIYLSAGQYHKTQGQIYTGDAYQEDSECS
jgi:hypothetical protein